MGNKEIKESAELNNSKLRIIFYGLIIHIILLFAVSDIYFTSPLDQNLEPVKSTKNPPANRVFLILVDGLRAESIFHKHLDRTPYLKTVTQNTGSWGVAHARAPTESRTGKTAILAGVYEDPSAIFKGWATYPIEIDTVLNRSRNVWYFGFPGVIKPQPNIHMTTLDRDSVDFASEDTFLLDKWTFELAESFLMENITKCLKNCKYFYENQTIFFIYLLGIDIAGHGSKPHSPNYIQNIAYMDTIVEKLSVLAASIFLDNKTTFVLTADHGMTDWGSHGGASQFETEVPFITWGAGINKHVKFSLTINQIDIAPLLASLLGLDIPTNSLGVTPINFLNLSNEQLAEIKLSNALQLMNKFNAKKFKIERDALFNIPFYQLSPYNLHAIMNALKIANYTHNHQIVIRECNKLIHLLLRGIEYYNNYYTRSVLFALSIGLIEWIIYLWCISTMEKSKIPFTKTHKRLIVISYGVSLALCYIQNFPLLDYLYFCFPIVMFSVIFPYVTPLKDIIFKSESQMHSAWLKRASVYILAVELIVFGFLYRALFTCLTLLLQYWVLFSINSSLPGLKISWTILSAILSVFPLLPEMITSFNIATYSLGFLIWVAFLNITFKVLSYHNCLFPRDIILFYGQFSFSILAFIHVILLQYEIIPNESHLKNLSWIYFTVPIILIAFSRRTILIRLASIFFGFLPYYLLVTFNFEAVFLALYVATLSFYLLIEVTARSDNLPLLFSSNFAPYECIEISTSLTFRRAISFISFIFLGFFGTGNVASLSSFNPLWVSAFLTVYNFIPMATLIGLKLAVPFVFTCCVFRAINNVDKESVVKMLCIILAISDFMILQLIFLVTNNGSWLEIGVSFSNFLIVEVFIVVLISLYGVTYLLTTVNFNIFGLGLMDMSVHIV